MNQTIIPAHVPDTPGGRAGEAILALTTDRERLSAAWLALLECTPTPAVRDAIARVRCILYPETAHS